MQRTGLAIMMKKREIRRKLLLAKKPELHEDPVELKRVELMHYKQFVTNKVPESEWKDNFPMSR